MCEAEENGIFLYSWRCDVVFMIKMDNSGEKRKNVWGCENIFLALKLFCQVLMSKEEREKDTGFHRYPGHVGLI